MFRVDVERVCPILAVEKFEAAGVDVEHPLMASGLGGRRGGRRIPYDNFMRIDLIRPTPIGSSLEFILRVVDGLKLRIGGYGEDGMLAVAIIVANANEAGSFTFGEPGINELGGRIGAFNNRLGNRRGDVCYPYQGKHNSGESIF